MAKTDLPLAVARIVTHVRFLVQAIPSLDEFESESDKSSAQVNSEPKLESPGHTAVPNSDLTEPRDGELNKSSPSHGKGEAVCSELDERKMNQSEQSEVRGETQEAHEASSNRPRRRRRHGDAGGGVAG